MDTYKAIRRSIGFFFLLVVCGLIVWYAVSVFLLAFAAILLAIFLTAMGEWASKITRLPYPIALIASIVFFAGILILIFWLYTPLIIDQFQTLIAQMPEAVENLKGNLTDAFNLNFDAFSQKELTQEFLSGGQKVFTQLTRIFTLTIGSIISFAIFLLVGFYLALDPGSYVKGFLLSFQPKNQAVIKRFLERIGHTLRWWLAGKIIAMITIGILSYVGLLLLDVSLAFILGLLAALLAFIPYIGPIIASIPAILLGFSQSPMMALYVALLYMGIHALEGYWITPYIEKKTVSMPPALTIMTQILMAVLLGMLGLALATPLTVVCIAILSQTHISKR